MALQHRLGIFPQWDYWNHPAGTAVYDDLWKTGTVGQPNLLSPRIFNLR